MIRAGRGEAGGGAAGGVAATYLPSGGTPSAACFLHLLPLTLLDKPRARVCASARLSVAWPFQARPRPGESILPSSPSPSPRMTTPTLILRLHYTPVLVLDWNLTPRRQRHRYHRDLLFIILHCSIPSNTSTSHPPTLSLNAIKTGAKCLLSNWHNLVTRTRSRPNYLRPTSHHQTGPTVLKMLPRMSQRFRKHYAHTNTRSLSLDVPINTEK